MCGVLEELLWNRHRRRLNFKKNSRSASSLCCHCSVRRWCRVTYARHILLLETLSPLSPPRRWDLNEMEEKNIHNCRRVLLSLCHTCTQGGAVQRYKQTQHVNSIDFPSSLLVPAFIHSPYATFFQPSVKSEKLIMIHEMLKRRLVEPFSHCTVN